MILLIAGRRGTGEAEALLVVAARLQARGHWIAVDEDVLPEDAPAHLRYEAAPWLADPGGVPADMVICLASAGGDAAALARLRRIPVAPAARIALVGRFADDQARISAEAGLAYAFGRAPLVVDLDALGPKPLAPAAAAPVHAGRSHDEPGAIVRPALAVCLSPALLQLPETLPVMSMLHHGRSVRLSVLTDGAGKELIAASRHSDLEVWRHSELPPDVLARRFDVAAVYRDVPPSERLSAVLAGMLARGRPVIDGTPGGHLMGSGAPLLRGPASVAGLPGYLEATVLPNLDAVRRRIADSAWARAADIARLEAALGLTPPVRAMDGAAAALPSPRIVFLPTNGVGLGHARRCLLIAQHLPQGADAAFAAFPSCVPMIRRAGFPCLPLVSRDDGHPDPGANDLVSHLRLCRALGTADSLVFDGGYVFDSVCRAIAQNHLPSVWIRRGLWQPGQVGSAAIEREKVFDRVIVPSEAFPELDDDMSFGEKVRRVGPVVEVGGVFDREVLRERLRAESGRAFTALAVTMLGGGVAADRTAQTIALCTLLERRSDLLHLIVVWPGSVVPQGLQGWSASRVVQTHAALDLMRAADFVVSAAGYNSFNELVYHRIPSILIPQMAPYMDDQQRRARAASDRDLAVTVEPHEFLGLEQALRRMVDGTAAADMRDSLRRTALPAPGTADAAALIMEVAQCRPTTG